MANTVLGDKHLCPSCGAKFYDLGRSPPTCPKCKSIFDPAAEGLRPKRTRERAKPAPEEELAEDEELDAEELEDAADEDEEDEEAEIEEVDEVVEGDLVDAEVEEEVEAKPDSDGPGEYLADDEVADDLGDDLEDDLVDEDEEDGLTVIDGDEEFDDEDIEIAKDDEEEL